MAVTVVLAPAASLSAGHPAWRGGQGTAVLQDKYRALRGGQ